MCDLVVTLHRRPAAAGLDTRALDLNMLLEELRQLRKQMTRTIDNNNELRRALQQNLASNAAGVHSNGADSTLATENDVSPEILRATQDESPSPRKSQAQTPAAVTSLIIVTSAAVMQCDKVLSFCALKTSLSLYTVLLFNFKFRALN